MAVKAVTPLLNTAANTERGPSEIIWAGQGLPAGYWVPDFIGDPRLGMQFFDDFLVTGPTPATGSALPWGQWAAYATTNGTLTDAAIVGGGITLAASTTAHQGVAIGSLTGSFQIISSGAVYQAPLAFETRVSMSTACFSASTADMFIGLMDNGPPASGLPITTTGGLLSTTPNLIGFHKRGGATVPTDWSFVFQLAGGTAVYPTNLTTLVTTVTGTAPVGGTYYKLGFLYTPSAPSVLISSASTGQTAGVPARPLITIFVNGVAAAAFLTSTNVGGATFPTGSMGPVLAFLQQSTTASVSANCDWIRVAQTNQA